ncbi:MAG: gliding motility protein GldC [Candidatus Dadabacteria bacterium]|nr:gliding motility protein GldC [Candidatus Dadabacteria bacterium]NIQ13895.1 gliding motility protein GldC [Candidatus Dadabacteria bacterium]
MSRKAEIKLTIRLGEDDVPEEIKWKATEADLLEDKNCEAMFLSMWDKEEKNSLIIDLWTKNMQVGEMNAHIFYTMMKMADTYQRATNNEELSNKMREFANDFASSVEEFVTADSK